MVNIQDGAEIWSIAAGQYYDALFPWFVLSAVFTSFVFLSI